MRTFILFGFFIISSIHLYSQKVLTVSKDSSGMFRTIQQAINAIPSPNNQLVTIMVKAGVYKERVVIDSGKNFISLKGDPKERTIITFGYHSGSKLYNGDTLNTWTCASVMIFANDFRAENIQFDNSAGFSAGQAVALRSHGTRNSFFKCAFTGNQDVLFLSGKESIQYFENCYIEGTTDFIFGASTAVFKKCRIHSKKNSHVTAASTTANNPYGFVFFNCELTANADINNVSLGRPWSPWASVTYINCEMGKHITPTGWNNWKNPSNEITARYSEYESSGPGANPNARVKWSKQLTEEELKKITIKNILGKWSPK